MKLNKLTSFAILSGLTIVLQLLSGLITSTFPFIPFSISLVLIPVAAAAWFYGLPGGLTVGTAFGLTVMVQCITGLDKTGIILFGISPLNTVLITVLRCVLMGAAIGLISMCKNKSTWFKYLFSCLAPIFNTGLFVLLFSICFHDTLLEWAGGSGNVLSFIIISFVGINFVVELLINIVLLPPLLKALEKTKRIQ